MTGRERAGIVRNAVSGLHAVLRERSSRAHIVVTIIVVSLGIALNIARDEWAWTVLALTLVWTAEAFNTAVEALGDAISPETHPRVGVAKDVAAAAVMICMIGSGIIFLVIFWPRFQGLLTP